MATLQTLPQDELDRRSEALLAALDDAWCAVVEENGGDAVTAASSPTAWARRIGRALSLLINTYLRAADQAVDDVDAGRETGVGLVSSEVVSRWADVARDRLVNSLSRLDAEGDPPGHLRTVAQTEVHGAANAGTRTQLEKFVDAGLTTITCTWRSRHDDRVRAWHREADGQQIKIDEAFRVGDSWLLAPGIPMPGRSFDVGDVCNCRCRVEYTYDIISSTRTSDDDVEAPVSDVDETALIAASNWKPEAHPRGKDGKFIKKGFLQSLLASKTPMVGQALNAINDLDDKQWNNLKPEQKQYVKDAVNKLPKSSTSYQNAKKKLDSLEPSAPSGPTVKPIPAHKGAKPGSPAKVTTSLVWGKYDADTVVLENAAGDQRIMWNGKNYVAQNKTSTGDWVDGETYTKKSFYDAHKGDTGWVVPGVAAAETVSPPTPLAPATSPTPAAATVSGKPDLDAPGGAPLSYDTGGVISNWPGALNASYIAPGDALAFKSDGSKRIVRTADIGGTKLYDVEKWNASTGKWETENKGVALGWFMSHQDTDLTGDWLMAKPDGKPYAIKKPVTSAPTPAPAPTPVATKLAQDLTLPDGTVNWVSLDAEVGTGKFAPGTVLVTHATPAGVNYRVIVADDGVSVQLQSQGFGESWQNFVGGATWSAESAAGELFAVKASDWKIDPKLAYSPDLDPNVSMTPGKPLTGNDAKSVWQLAETKATGDVVAEGVSGSGQKLQIIVAPYGLKAQVYSPAEGWLDFYAAASQSQTAHMLNTAGMKWSTPAGGPTGLPTTPATAGPVHVSTAAKAADAAASPMGAGGDISGISDAVKKDMKSVLKDDKIGYWSKPDKIWDSVQKIQQKYADPANPGNSQYTPLQVLKSLDSTLKTSDPSPFETKITKWAATPKGQAYISKSAAPAATPGTTPGVTPPAKKFPSVTSDVPNYDVAWGQGKPLTGAKVAELVKNGEHLDIVAIHVKGSVQHRVIRSTDDPDTGEPRFYVQRRDDVTTGGWDVVKPAGTDNGIMKTGDELDKYFPGMKFRSVEGVQGATSGTAAVPAPSLKKGPSVPIHAGSDDVSHLTPDQKSAVYAKFKSHKNVYVSSPELSIFTGLKNTAQDNNLSVMQVLKVVDEVGADKVGAPNSQLFEKKITAWLGTKQGTIAAGSEALSEALARKVDYTPGTSDAGIMSFNDSSKLTYKNVSIAAANKFGTDVQKQGGLPSTQTGAMNKYTGGVYSAINSYLYGGTDTITPTNMATAKNVQKSMRASTEPMLLHRGVYFDGVANSTSHSDLESKVGQTWLSGGFFSTSVGSKAAFSGKPVALEIEAPPGTPMSWLEPHSKYPGEHEMLLAAGLRYRIVSVSKNSAGKSVVRLRVVPPTEEVTV